MQRTVKTTTLIVEKPVGFEGLEATFKLIRYELPAELRWRQNRNDYGQMHNSLRDQLDYPYKAFKYDRLDGGVPKWVVYALYPRDVDVQEIASHFSSPDTFTGARSRSAIWTCTCCSNCCTSPTSVVRTASGSGVSSARTSVMCTPATTASRKSTSAC